MKTISESNLKYLKDRFTRYEDYYQILRISKKNVSDEAVEKAYKFLINQVDKLFRESDKEENKQVKELKEEIIETLDNAYNALKTENSRKSYDELINSIEGEER